MHQNAMEKIQSITNGALQNCFIVDRWPQFQSYTEHVDSLTKEVLKHKGEWLIESDVYSIFLDLVYKNLADTFPEDSKLTGNLKDLLTTEQFNTLSGAICDYLESIPRNYEVYLPLPSVKDIDFESLEICEGVWLKTFNKSEDVPGGNKGGLLGLFKTQLDTNMVYLCIREKGYSGGAIENSCTREALSGFKLLLHAGIFRMLFKLEEKKPLGLMLMGSYGQHQIPKVSLITVDLQSKDKGVKSSELSIDITRFVQKICLASDIEFVKKAQEAGEEHFKSLFLHIFNKAAQLIYKKDEFASPIKSAIEWAIDSKAEENKTLSFIQTCIGLECILGEGVGDLPVTATLADRCSYLIGTDPKGRKTIKEKFKKLYKFRSQLVHGNISRLSKEADEYHRWGQVILDFAISKEIKNYKIEEF